MIRPFQGRDADAVLHLSLEAWAPVFASLQDALGRHLFQRLHPDWRADQEQAVADVLDDGETAVWVAEVEAGVVGFVAIRLDEASSLGEIYMIAVDPEHQRRGIGGSLTDHAVAEIGRSGMATVMVETGGDPGHAPARATYEQAGFTLLPIARYFKPL